MSGKETPMSTDDSSTSESESSASSPPVERRRRRPRATATPPETPMDQEVQEAASSTAAARRNEVRGSMGDGNGEPSAQLSAGASGSARAGSGFEPRLVYTPQACRLCCRPTIYLTRSGLSDHATVHHGHWYSAKQDEYVPIPEADLVAKRELIKKGQAHRKFRRDPADNPPQTAGQDRPPHLHHRLTATKHGMRPQKRAPPASASTPSGDTRKVEHRPSSPSDRRVTSCTVDLGVAWYAPLLW